MKTVKIGGKPYPVHFGLSTIKNFALANGMKTIDEFDDFMAKVQESTLQGIAMLSELLLAGIERGCQLQNVECDLDADTILDLYTDDPAAFSALSEALGESFRREPTTVAKQGGKKKTKQPSAGMK